MLFPNAIVYSYRPSRPPTVLPAQVGIPDGNGKGRHTTNRAFLDSRHPLPSFPITRESGGRMAKGWSFQYRSGFPLTREGR